MREVSAAGGPVVLAADGYAFPSAHAAIAAAAFGVLAYLCAAGLRSWAGRVTIWAAAEKRRDA